MSISFVKIEIVIAFLDKTFQSSYNFLKLYCRRYRTMGVELTIADSSVLTTEEQADLSKRIDALIAAHKNNRQEINRLVFESVSAMTTGEDYERQLSNKRGLRRFFGSITGSNKRLQDKINSSRAAAQYATQCTLQKLAEENLMTFDLITAVNNKLNASMTAVEGELNQVYAALLQFFKQSRSDVLQLGQRVDRLEQNVNLLNWQNSIEYQMFNGVEYMDLDDTAKIICLVRDFYDITQGQWTTMDLLLLKSAMGTIGISLREKIDYYHFIQTVSNNAQLRSKLLGEKQIYGVPENYLVPLLSMKKLALLDNEEAFIVGTVEESLADAGVPTDRQSIEGKLLTKYMAQEAHVDLTTQVPHYDLILELLFNLQNAENSGILRTQEEIKAFEETTEQEAAEAPLDPEDAEEIDTPVDAAPAQANPYLKIPELCERVRDGKNLSGILRDALDCRFRGQFDQEFTCYQEVVRKAYDNTDKGIAYNNLAYMYDNGDHVSADPYKALEYYRMAAEQGNDVGKFNLGICYLNGLGTEPNIEQGKYWLGQIQEDSSINETAKNILSYCFNERQTFSSVSSDKYIRMYNRFSAILELSENESDELTRYQKDKNYIGEIDFYKKTIRDSTVSPSHKAFSYNNMGYLYENGLGVPQDHAKAFEYYYEAAKLESSTGKCNLGFCYLNGIGVNRDKEMAKYWLEKVGVDDRCAFLMRYC